MRRRIVALLLPVLLLAGLAVAPAQPAYAATTLTCIEYLVGALICSPPIPAPAGLRYTTYDTTGQAATPGSYAFLDAAGDVVTTYEGLRDRTTTGLRIHTSDADGASQVGVYGGIAVGDIFEWREAADCFVRYEVTEVKADPASTAPRKEFAIKWHAYAFTGCTGTVAADAAVNVTWSPELNFLSTPTTVPVRYGPFELVPLGWKGVLEEVTKVPRASSGGSGAAGISEGTEDPEWPSGDPAVVRQHPLWNEPTLPAGWTISSMSAEEWYVGVRYLGANRHWAAITWIARRDYHPRMLRVGYPGGPDYAEEVRTIDGHPAYLHHYRVAAAVYIIDDTAGVEYFAVVFASASDPDGRGIDDAIALARSLYE